MLLEQPKRESHIKKNHTINRVCEAVAAVAKSVQQSYGKMTQRHRLLLRLLAMMPQYRDSQKLVAWEYAVKALLEDSDETSELGSIIVSIYELGICNFYGKFESASAMGEYERCSKKLAELDIPLPTVTKLVKY